MKPRKLKAWIRCYAMFHVPDLCADIARYAYRFARRCDFTQEVGDSATAILWLARVHIIRPCHRIWLGPVSFKPFARMVTRVSSRYYLDTLADLLDPSDFDMADALRLFAYGAGGDEKIFVDLCQLCQRRGHNVCVGDAAVVAELRKDAGMTDTLPFIVTCFGSSRTKAELLKSGDWTGWRDY